MGLLKRMVIALEKIAERKPIDAETMQSVLKNSFDNMTTMEEKNMRIRQQNAYDWLKKKQCDNKDLTPAELENIEFGDNQVRLGILNAFTE